MTKKVQLPSGAELEIWLAPFAKSKALYQAILEEAKTLKFDPNADIDVNLFKDLFCAGFSSKKIDQALDECMKHVTYNQLRVNAETWEPAEARQDYGPACFEVVKENVLPFLKSLYAQLSPVLDLLQKSPA